MSSVLGFIIVIAIIIFRGMLRTQRRSSRQRDDQIYTPPPSAPPRPHVQKRNPQKAPPGSAPPQQPRPQHLTIDEEHYDSYAEDFERYYYGSQNTGREIYPWEMPPEKGPWEK